MSSRMERYNNSNNIKEELIPSRVSKNTSLYEDIKSSELSRVKNNNNIRVLENNGKTIDIDKIKRYIESNNNIDVQKRESRIDVSISREEPVKQENNSPKVYDINSVLEKARQKREINYESERYKKLRDTQYDILSKLDVYEKETVPSKENLETDFNTDERTLIDLINTVTIHKGDVNLLEDLLPSEGEEVTLPIEKEIERSNILEETKEEKPNIVEVTNNKITNEEIEKTQELVSLKEKSLDIDKSFYTTSNSFSKTDFEGLDELEKSVKKNSIFTSIIVIVIIIFVIISLIIMLNYVFNLGLF